jgi:hypothetical protein
MKTFKCFIVLFAIVGLTLVGCSEKTQLPNEPVDSLEKVTTTDYTGTITIVGIVDEGATKMVGQNIIVKDMVVQTRFESSTDLMTGDQMVTINFQFDLNTGEGNSHGKWSIVPDAYPDDLWEGSYSGHRTKTGESEWTDNLHIVGKGKGEVIGGMKTFTDALIYSNDIYLQTGFFGVTSGVIKSK